MPRKKSESQSPDEGGESTTTAPRRKRGPESESTRLNKIDEIAGAATVTFRAEMIEMLANEKDPVAAAEHALQRAKDLLRVAKLAQGFGDISRARLARLLKSYDADPVNHLA